MEVVLRLRRAGYLALGVWIALIGASVWLATSTGAVHVVASAVWVVAIIGPGALYRRTVTIVDDGLTIRRGSYGRFFCPWSVVGVQRRHVGPFALDQLRLRAPVRRHTSYSSTAPPEVTWRPASSKRVFIGLYDKNWRTGLIGTAMTAHGDSVAAIAPRIT